MPKVGNIPNLLAHFTHCGQGGWSPHLVSTCKQTSPHISPSPPEQDSDQVTIEPQLTGTLLVGAVRSAQGEGEDTIWPPPPYTTRMAIRCPLLLSHIYPSLYLSAVPGTIAHRSKGFQGITNSWRLLSLVLVPRPAEGPSAACPAPARAGTVVFYQGSSTIHCIIHTYTSCGHWD